MAGQEKRNRRVSFNRLDGSEESQFAEHMTREGERMAARQSGERPAPAQDARYDQVAEDEDVEWRRAGGKAPGESA